MKTKENTLTGAFNKSIFQTLYFAYKPSLGVLIILMFAGLLGRLFILGNSNIIGIWVDHLLHPEIGEGFFGHFENKSFVILLLGMNIAGLVLGLTFRIGFSVISAQAVSQIYDETTYRASRFPMSFFDRTPTGRIVTRFSSDYGSVFRLFGGPLAEFLSILMDLIGMIFLIALASPLYLPAILFVGALNYLVYRFNQARLRESRRVLSASRSPSIAHFAETTQGSVTIRSFNREAAFAQRFSKLDQQYLTNKFHVVKNLLLYSLQMNSLSSLLFVMTGGLAFYLVQNGTLSVGSVGVAFSFILLSGNTVQMFFEWLAQFEEALIGLERLDQYLRMPLEPGAHLPQAAKFPTQHSKRSSADSVASPFGSKQAVSLKFDGVWMRYSDKLPWVLKNISFEIKAGQKLGVIGSTGSGKSTLIQILLQFYNLDRGQIIVDGAALSSFDLEAFRSGVGFIPQEPVLFSTSLRENLDPGQSYSDAKLSEALSGVGLMIPLDFKIEEKGKNLSLGEKQLICLVRCLLEDRPLIIMDEATSSVDPHSEEMMSQAITHHLSKKTQILIAHRLSTLQGCDKILWLEKGEVRAFGEPLEILAQFKKESFV
jgi:ABC-type multidrug transport system fused ATPase/permease subunit